MTVVLGQRRKHNRLEKEREENRLKMASVNGTSFQGREGKKQIENGFMFIDSHTREEKKTKLIE